MSHAGGVIFKDEPFTESVSLMRTPKGEIITAYDLHDVEACGDIKYDVLSVEALDKIHNCIDLLCDYGYAERKSTLKDTYENIIGIYNLEREDPQMWKMVHNHEILSLFQMEQASGIKGISLTKPSSVKDLATLNSVIRLMAPEKGAEQPLDMWDRYRRDITQWHREMEKYGLSDEQIEWLSNYPDITQGIAESQECLMKLVQEDRLGGNNLNFADKCRKGLAKKDGPLFKQCEEEFFKNAEEKKCDMKLVHYVWDILLRVQRNYSFNKSHTLAYSLIALQEMNLAFKYPIIFWNCACLISDSSGAQMEEQDNIEDSAQDINECEVSYLSMEDFGAEYVDDDEEEDEEDDEEISEVKKKKKKAKTTNYGRIATAIGKMKSVGVSIQSPDINNSSYTFSPDAKQNLIRYGLSGITRIGEDLIKEIINNRPYISIEDFLSKVKINKPQMVNLIKAGAFDCFGKREDVMHNYIDIIADKKKRLTLQNMQMLINYQLLPESLEFNIKVFNFNKYLKKFKDGNDYILNDISFAFFEKNYDVDLLTIDGDFYRIKQTIWDKKYQAVMNPVRDYIKSNNSELLNTLNNKLFDTMWNKYCLGNISKWEMESVSCYFHNHELYNINNFKYQLNNYFDLPENPEIDRIISMKGKEIPLYKITRIAGTILDKDKSKKTVTLLTTEGVVTVKIYGDVYNHYDRQISEKNLETGKKKVIEKSWLSRGNKIIVTGIRREEEFIAKKYKNTPYHLVELIKDIDEKGNLIIQNVRIGEEE